MAGKTVEGIADVAEGELEIRTGWVGGWGGRWSGGTQTWGWVGICALVADNSLHRQASHVILPS